MLHIIDLYFVESEYFTISALSLQDDFEGHCEVVRAIEDEE